MDAEELLRDALWCISHLIELNTVEISAEDKFINDELWLMDFRRTEEKTNAICQNIKEHLKK